MAKITAYVQKEKLLLANLVDKHKLVEDKQTDAATVQKKQAEWTEIATEYNSQGSIVTVPRNLKKLWNNLKQKKRRQNTEQIFHRLATGGGLSLAIPNDPVMDAVELYLHSIYFLKS